MEEGRPVDVFAQGGEREIVEDAHAGELGRGNVLGAPLDGGAAGAGFGQRNGLHARRGVRLAHRLVVGTMLHEELFPAFVAEQAGGDGHGAAGVEHVDDRLTIERRDFDGGVRAAGGCAADEQG